MCGIVGALAKRDIAPLLLEGLKRLEYRGYDSAGIAVLNPEHNFIQRIRTEGKVAELQAALNKTTSPGFLGIAHTRWATHGKPSESNAHPHLSYDNLAIVHNGIIENHDELRHELKTEGYEFYSETDTEVAVHFIHKFLEEGYDLITATQKARERLKGAFAFGIISKDFPDQLVAVRHGSPLVIGIGKDENFIASDVVALLPVAKHFIYLEDGDTATITLGDIQIFGKDSKKVERQIHAIEMSSENIDKGAYRHYMQKEIHEQPRAIRDTLESRLGEAHVLDGIFGVNARDIFQHTDTIHIIACGTSYHSGLVAKHWIENLTRIPTHVEIASEFRYRNPIVGKNTLFVSISQSGETADTLAALRQAKNMGYLARLGICNVAESSLVRESDLVFMTHAGIEIGVASTKAFTTQLTCLLLLALSLSETQKKSQKEASTITKQLKQLPALIEKVLNLDIEIRGLAKRFSKKENCLFLGRGAMLPIAMEGALKLKEISYIHAEAYPAGELKHGPLALVDQHMPIVALAPNDELIDKLLSNLSEVQAREGELIVFADESINSTQLKDATVIKLPYIPHSLAPIVYTIPLQLLAYHVAVLKGTDVDQPRNLAKSVTVE